MAIVDHVCSPTSESLWLKKIGALLIRGWFAKMSFCGFHGSGGFLEILKLIVFGKSVLSNVHLVVLVVSVALVKKEATPCINKPLPEF